MDTSEEWTMNPYSFSLDKVSEYGKPKEDLIEQRPNRALQMQFESSLHFGRVLMLGYSFVSKTL